jgi:hypothetical protein
MMFAIERTEFFRLLGCYAAYCGMISAFRDYPPVLSSRVKLSNKMGQIGWPATSVSNNRTPRNNPEKRKNSFQPRRKPTITHERTNK